ncbi:MAG TPA: universal stress protein [Acidimicrobiales bacterium]|nr:universal stress protein [Acidimicrobiales bacterium]
MITVLAAIDDSPTAECVLRAAHIWSSLLTAELRAVHVNEDGPPDVLASAARAGLDVQVLDGDPGRVLLDLASDPSVGLVVIGSRRAVDGARPAGHIAIALVEHAGVPVLVVPPEWVSTTETRVRKVLVPLEGSAATTSPIAAILRQLADAGVALLAVHVFAPGDVPRFSDHSLHAEEGLAASFAERWCTEAPTEVRLLVGAEPETVMEAVDAERPDAVALTWAQDLSPGHAGVVRAALERSHRPVLLVPQGAVAPPGT